MKRIAIVLLLTSLSNVALAQDGLRDLETGLMTDIMRGLLGMTTLIAVAFLISSNRRNIDWTLVGKGVILQIVLGLAILKIPFVYNIFDGIADFFIKILEFTEAGSNFVLGAWPDYLIVENVADSNNPFTIGYVFAFKVLPTIVFFAAFSSLLYYLGILQKIVYVLAWLMSKLMNMSGAESLAAAANVFIGQTEAPLVVRPYLEGMTRSEIMCLMTGGMATIAGGVFGNARVANGIHHGTQVDGGGGSKLSFHCAARVALFFDTIDSGDIEGRQSIRGNFL